MAKKQLILSGDGVVEFWPSLIENPEDCSAKERPGEIKFTTDREKVIITMCSTDIVLDREEIIKALAYIMDMEA